MQEPPVKKAYARVDLKNCNIDFDYTICEWPDVKEYVELMQQTAEDLDEEGFITWQANGWLPEATVSVVMMTEEEYSNWFRDNVEANA